MISPKKNACPHCENFGAVITLESGKLKCGKCKQTYTEEEAFDMTEDWREVNDMPHTTKGELLEETITVYQYKDFRTTSSWKFDKYLESQFSDEATIPAQYSKIKGVTVEQKKFKEVEEEPENPHLSRIDEEANTAERLEEITGKETRRKEA